MTDALLDSDGALGWIEGQAPLMRERVEAWSAINSGSYNRRGVDAVGAAVAEAVARMGARSTRHPTAAHREIDDQGEAVERQLGDVWVWEKASGAPRRVLLAVHLDTVFASDHPFQAVAPPTRDDPEFPGREILRGPGVADAKGGIALLWTALEALERSRYADALDWTVLLNGDEEIGSPTSLPFLQRYAQGPDFGLVFEPTLPDGTLIGRRKGSGNFSAVVRGRSAHVGRAFDDGRSAIHALAALIERVAALGTSLPGAIANTGFVRGGGAVNVVPEFALARFNLRVDDAAAQAEVEAQLARAVAEVERRFEVSIELDGAFYSPPKPLDGPTEVLLGELRRCGESLGLPIRWRDSGGVCDGNKLAAAGLPNVDTLGPCGGNIHSADEYLDLESLVPRAQLVAALLMRFASGAFHPRKGQEGNA